LRRLAVFGSTLRGHRAAVLGLLFLGVLVVSAIVAPYLIPDAPDTQSLEERLLPATFSIAPYHQPLGTDNLGRDVLARIVYGARVSLEVGCLSVLVGGTIGTPLGLIAGYAGGAADEVIMRLIDAQLALPFILLAISIVSIVGPSERNVVIILGLSSWVSYGRVVRSQILTLRELEFVEAARALGASTVRILFRHLFINILPTVIIIASLQLSTVILAEAALSFLGLGVPPTQPTWGNMLGDARNYILVAPWLITWPGLALTITVVSLNSVANWLRDFLDPKTRTSRDQPAV